MVQKNREKEIRAGIPRARKTSQPYREGLRFDFSQGTQIFLFCYALMTRVIVSLFASICL